MGNFGIVSAITLAIWSVSLNMQLLSDYKLAKRGKAMRNGWEKALIF